FDEAAGSTALDMSGFGRSGTYASGSSAPQPSVLAPMLMFPNPRSRAFNTSNNTQTVLRNIPAAVQPVTNITLSAWFRATAVTDSDNLAEIINLADGHSLYINKTAVGFSKRIGRDNYLECNATIAQAQHLDGGWHHLAGVATPGSGMVLYYD